MTNVHQFPKTPAQPGMAVPPEYSDEALALRFASSYAKDLRYVAAMRCWFRWDGVRWVKDTTLRSRNLARALCRDASSECSRLPIGTKIASAKTIAAVEQLAKADQHLAATVDQWDTDRWLLNTPGGTIDLHTGEMKAHDPGDYCTKITAVAPGGECPLWLKSLMQIFGGDTEQIEFLQRLAGYALTGEPERQEPGTQDLRRPAWRLSLHRPNRDVYEQSVRPSSHRVGKALRRTSRDGSSETEEGRRWAESRVKAITGGDRQAARFMRQDFFEFEPQFKLVIAGNHKPGLKSVDEAIRRRFHLIPFKVTIPEAEMDLALGEKLKKEWPGILAWAVKGCLGWQAMGLKPSASVLQATADYLEAEDSCALWLEESCECDRPAYIPFGLRRS